MKIKIACNKAETEKKTMDKIPENSKDIREILCKQLALLAEVSEKNKNEPNVVVAASHAMDKIAGTLFS